MRNPNRISTNSKEFKNCVKRWIIDWFEDRKSDYGTDDAVTALIEQVDNYIRNFRRYYIRGISIKRAIEEGIKAGDFDVYYSQVAETMSDWFQVSVDEIWKYYNDNEDRLWISYINILSRNILDIYNEYTAE